LAEFGSTPAEALIGVFQKLLAAYSRDDADKLEELELPLPLDEPVGGEVLVGGVGVVGVDGGEVVVGRLNSDGYWLSMLLAALWKALHAGVGLPLLS
jgi:hypothetical protein